VHGRCCWWGVLWGVAASFDKTRRSSHAAAFWPGWRWFNLAGGPPLLTPAVVSRPQGQWQPLNGWNLAAKHWPASTVGNWLALLLSLGLMGAGRHGQPDGGAALNGVVH